MHWITPIDPKADDEHAQALLSLPNVKHWSKTRVERIEGDASGVTGIRLRPRHGDTEVGSVLPRYHPYATATRRCRSRPWRLQPYAMEAATLCAGGCNPM